MDHRRLATNTLWNLVGMAAPLIAALVATPFLIAGFGTARFGVLTMAWGVIGYFSLFDLGLGRALTQLVAERMGAAGQAEVREVREITWTALALMVGLGGVGALAIAALTPALTGSILRIPPEMRREGAAAFYILAAALPAVTSTAGLRGLLEAKQEFALLNLIRLPMGLLTFLGPLAVLPFSPSLVPATAVLALGRFAGWFAHLVVCLKVVPSLREGLTFRRRLVGRLLRFGGWMTVSNVSSTLMVYLDRFVIGALVSMAAVAYYVTPYEMASRLGMIPGALLAAVFPALATVFVSSRDRAVALFHGTLRVVFVVVFPLALVLVTLAHEGLVLWLGDEFARESTRVLQWIAVGVFLNSMGLVPATGIQGVGRPDLTGKLNLIELPFYLAALWLLLLRFGIEGAAIAWTLRMAIDTSVLLLLARRAGIATASSLRLAAALIVGASLVFGGAVLLEGLMWKGAFLALFAAGFAAVSWSRILGESEREAVRAKLQRMPPARWLRGTRSVV